MRKMNDYREDMMTDNTFELSLGQKYFYLYEHDGPKEVIENHLLMVGTGFFDSALLDADAIEKAYFEVLRRNEVFRMRLVSEKRRVKMRFTDTDEFPKPKRMVLKGGFSEFSRLCSEPRFPDMTVWDPFLTEAVIYTCADGTGGIIIYQHHICTDGFSTDVILSAQINEFYECFKAGLRPEEPARIYSFAEYAEKERENQKRKRKANIKWWRREYNRHFMKYGLPIRTPDLTTREGSISQGVCGERYEAFKRVLSEHNFTNASAVLSLLAVLVRTVSPVDRFSIGSGLHGHMTYVQKNTCGPMLNEIPVFFEIEKDMTLLDVCLYTFRKLAGSYQHITYFDENTEYMLSLLPRLSCRGLTANMEWLSVYNLCDYPSEKGRQLRMLSVPQPQVTGGCYLEISKLEGEEGMEFQLRFDADTLTQERAEELKNVFLCIMDVFCSDPGATVEECIRLVSAKK